MARTLSWRSRTTPTSASLSVDGPLLRASLLCDAASSALSLPLARAGAVSQAQKAVRDAGVDADELDAVPGLLRVNSVRLFVHLAVRIQVPHCLYHLLHDVCACARPNRARRMHWDAQLPCSVDHVAATGSRERHQQWTQRCLGQALGTADEAQLPRCSLTHSSRRSESELARAAAPRGAEEDEEEEEEDIDARSGCTKD